jgi:hypothetical protein
MMIAANPTHYYEPCCSWIVPPMDCAPHGYGSLALMEPFLTGFAGGRQNPEFFLFRFEAKTSSSAFCGKGDME